jgi:hypothetical protein
MNIYNPAIRGLFRSIVYISYVFDVFRLIWTETFLHVGGCLNNPDAGWFFYLRLKFQSWIDLPATVLVLFSKQSAYGIVKVLIVRIHITLWQSWNLGNFAQQKRWHRAAIVVWSRLFDEINVTDGWVLS